MTASRSAREKKAASEAGPLAKVKIDLDGAAAVRLQDQLLRVHRQGQPQLVGVPARR